MRFSTPEHLQSNGIVERFNRTFKAMLRHVVQTHQREWDQYVPCILWAYRETPHDATGFSPFELMYGRVPRGPLDVLRKTWSGEWAPPTALNRSAVGYLADTGKRMAKAGQLAQERSNRYRGSILSGIINKRLPNSLSKVVKYSHWSPVLWRI